MPGPEVVQRADVAAGCRTGLGVHRMHLADRQPFDGLHIADPARNSLGSLSTQPVASHG